LWHGDDTMKLLENTSSGSMSMHIDTELQRIALSELEDGENLLWCGRPNAKRAFVASLAIFLFAIPWTAFALFWMWGASGFGKAPDGFNIIFSLFGVPFVLIGFAMMAMPYWAYRKAQKTIYALSDRRVVIIEGGKSKTVHSYGRGDLGTIKRTELADGSGDLTFAQKHSTDSDGDRRTTDISLIGIPQVRSVEQMLREALIAGPENRAVSHEP